MTRIAAPWLDDPATAAVTGMLAAAGHRALFVGGCVRNAVIGLDVADIDIATEARPERVAPLAERRRPQGGADRHRPRHRHSGQRRAPFEVTTFRRDVATDGRRATVAYSDDIAEDAARRDFTMNALYAAPDGCVLDPVGTGLADLAARRVRFVGDPAARIAEDYLRVLRFFRFHAWYGDPARGLDPAALAACAAARDGLARLSRERVGAETTRLLAAPDPAPAVAAMAEAGILAAILPGADPGLLAPLVHTEAAAGAPPRWQRRLAALGDAAAWAEGLRLSRAAVATLRRTAAARAAVLPLAARAHRFGADPARDAALLDAAARGTPPPPGLDAALARGAAARFPLRAADLPHLAGPPLGAALARLEEAWLASDLTLDREALLAREPAPGA
jgi:poly(A) polymerase